LPEAPQPVHKAYEIRSPECRWESEWPPGADNPSLRFTWITTWPATGELIIEGERRFVLPFEKSLQNHVLDWRDFAPGARYRWRIVTETPLGETITAGPFEVEASAPAEPQSRAEHATLALTLTNRSQAALAH